MPKPRSGPTSTTAPQAGGRVSPSSAVGPAPALDLAIDLARIASDDKCTDVVLLDVRGLSQITDYLLIASGTSDRQMSSVLQHLEEEAGRRGSPSFRGTRGAKGTWLVADFVDIVAHVFEPSTRAHYDLEMLWGDARPVAWERPGSPERNRAGLRPGDRVDDGAGQAGA